MEKKFLLLSILVGLNVGLGWNLLKVQPVLQLHVFNIGQGDALLVTTPEQNHILVDGGPGNTVLEELGDVLPLLFKEIDLMVLTHPHADHVNGLVPVLDRFHVKAILLSGPEYDNEAYAVLLAKALEQKIPIYFARSDEDFAFGDTQLDVIFPFQSVVGETFDNVNNASVVLRVVEGEHEILLTGDAEQEVEEALVRAEDEGRVTLAADVLKAGHHGSRSSSTTAFLEVVGAELMLISAGVGNDYGHPHPETLETADELGMEVRRTDLEGKISIYFY